MVLLGKAVVAVCRGTWQSSKMISRLELQVATGPLEAVPWHCLLATVMTCSTLDLALQPSSSPDPPQLFPDAH